MSCMGSSDKKLKNFSLFNDYTLHFKCTTADLSKILPVPGFCFADTHGRPIVIFLKNWKIPNISETSKKRCKKFHGSCIIEHYLFQKILTIYSRTKNYIMFYPLSMVQLLMIVNTNRVNNKYINAYIAWSKGKTLADLIYATHYN